MKTLEKDSGGFVTSEKHYLWAGGNQPAEERDASNTVSVRYLAQGEQVPGASSPEDKLFYTKDHLGSVREVTDSSGEIRVRYAYDVYGSRTQITGDLSSEGVRGSQGFSDGQFGGTVLGLNFGPFANAGLVIDPQRVMQNFKDSFDILRGKSIDSGCP